MGRQIGRSSALGFLLGVLTVTFAVVWSVDLTTGGSLRDTILNRVRSAEVTDASARRTRSASETDRSSRGASRRTPKVAAGSKAAPVKKGAAADPRSSCTLTGRVVDEEHRPVRGAKVNVRNTASYNKSATTDAAGRFTLAGIPTGTFDVFASHANYVALVRPGFTLDRAGQTATMEFTLPLGATLKGIVRDEAGKALEGVRVAARRKQAQALAQGNVYLDDSMYKTLTTGKDGTFSVGGVSLGGNVIEFSKTGYEGQVRELLVRPMKDQPKVQIVLRKTGILAGTVADDHGKPVSTATVHLVRYKPASGPAEILQKGKITATTDGHGRFKFQKLFTEGFYDLLIDDARFAPVTFPLIPVGSTEVTCPVEPGGQIAGKAEYIDRLTTAASVLLTAETVIKGTTFTAEARSSAEGEFRFERLPYGNYKLGVRTSGLACEPGREVPCNRNAPTRGVVVEVYEASTVKGRVSDGRTDAPVAGATVAIEAVYGRYKTKKRTFQVRADQHGGFAFYRIPAGTHTARATAQGFLKTISDRSETEFNLQPGERKSDLALILDRGGIVSGHVLNQNGHPLPDADVQLFSPSNAYGNIDDRGFKGKTDGTGYFEISGIEVGERTQLYASARKEGYAKGRSPIIDLTSRQPEAATHITLSPGGFVSGRVTDSESLPIPGARLRFISSEFPGDPSSSVVTAQSRADGTYVLANVTPGEAQVAVTRSGFAGQTRKVTVKESSPTENINFTLEPGLEIEGKVEALDGNPIADARVRATKISRGRARSSESGITDRNGRFKLSNLSSGDYRLEATFKLATPEGDQSYLFVNPSVPAGSTNADIGCDVGNLLTGQVVDQDNHAINNYMVSLRSREDTRPTQDFSFDLDRKPASGRGAFQIHKIPRGVYVLRISADGYEPYQEEYLAVGPTRRTDLPRIKLRSAGGLVGELVSSSTNRPVNGVRVRLLNSSLGARETHELPPSTTSDGSGRFRITTAVEGTYDVEFSHPSYLPHKLAGVDVTARKLTDLGRIYLEAGGTIRGTVTNGEGEPVRSMRMKISGLDKEIRTDAGGNYLFQGVQPGRWHVVARGSVNNRNVYSWQPAVVQPDETEIVDFVLETSADLDGLIAAAGEQGRVKTGSVHLHPFDENALVLKDVHYDASITPANGRFRIRQIPPGAYFLWASGVAANNAAYTTWQLLTLARGSNDAVVTVGGAQMKGTAKDGLTSGGVRRVTVQLRPLFDTLRLPQKIYDELVRTDVTANNGRYSFGSLQPGPYQLLYRPSGGSWYAQPPVTIGPDQQISDYDLLIP